MMAAFNAQFAALAKCQLVQRGVPSDDFKGALGHGPPTLEAAQNLPFYRHPRTRMI
jgi:hypothetical protein